MSMNRSRPAWRNAGSSASLDGGRLWAKDQNDPIVLLEADHRRFEDLLEGTSPI